MRCLNSNKDLRDLWDLLAPHLHHHDQIRLFLCRPKMAWVEPLNLLQVGLGEPTISLRLQITVVPRVLAHVLQPGPVEAEREAMGLRRLLSEGLKLGCLSELSRLRCE